MSDATEQQGSQEGAADKDFRGTLLVVDGHSLAFRAYFALPVENFSTTSGQATNAVWGFATMLAQVIEAEHPDRLAVAFDVKGGTFRNTLLPQYKGTRDAAPEDLLTQLPLIQELLDALGVAHIEKQGYEGDDIIGTLATMGEDAGYRTLVLSGDRDAFQLVDNAITVLFPGHHFKDLKHMTPQAVEEKYHVSPQQYPDLAALRGETADNIPGVPGVGDGYAAKWINQYGSLEGIIEHADDIGGKKGQALRDNIEQVKLNRKVNALVRDVKLDVGMDDFAFGPMDPDRVAKLFSQLEFGVRTRSKVMKAFGGKPAGAAAVSPPQAGAAEAGMNQPGESIDVMHAQDASQLRAWLQRYAASLAAPDDGRTATAGSSASSAHAASSGPEDDERLDTPVERTGLDIDHDAQGAEHVRRGWVLYAEGSGKPGDAHCTRIALLVEDKALVLACPLDDDTRSALQGFIDRHHGEMIVHGYKEHMHLLEAAGLVARRPVFDTKLAGYLVLPDFHPESLDQAAERFIDVHIDEHERPAQGQLDLDGTDCDEDTHDDAAVATRLATIRELAVRLSGTLDERKQYGLLTSLELPVSEVLFHMEDVGACVDQSRLVALRDQFAADARQAQEIAWKAAGREINLQSPKQLRTILFEDLGLKPLRRTKSGQYTTDAATLTALYARSANGNERANDFLGALLRHRETNKLRQIVQTLIDATNQRDSRIHTTFEQTVAATGRLSSVDPNLQNIPNRNVAGREIRSAFVPGPGYASLLSCDYSQVELRIMADLSGDEALIEAFRSGADFHKYVASLVYQVPVSEITPDQRSHVKAMSYGLAYGLSTYGLAQQLHISPAEADVLKEKYFATFGKVHDYLESLVANARRDGYTETVFGRRRYFPALHSAKRQAREAAERAALNAPIQGSAADIMKIAMVRADQALRDAGVASRIILQIHDELVVEIAPGEQEQVSALVSDAMEHAVKLAVPLDVSVGIGADWQLAAH
ncbi:DNA polymerase I [Bifidobacterium thermophilum]|uniref:DNA polymerase I n=1 Tax=Bifidobacterium thermophilum TaxID=33905 RepID=UPI0030977504